MAAKNKPQGGADKVTSIHRGKPVKPGAIVPEPGWKPRGRYGVMRTPEGAELVALDDLVHWLADRDGLTLQQAISKVLDALQPADLACLHFSHYENPAADPGELREWEYWDAVHGVDRELATPFVDGGKGFTQFARQVPLALMRDESGVRAARWARFGTESPELADWWAKPEAERSLILLRERVRIEVAARAKSPKPEDGEVIAEAFISILATRANELYGWGSVAVEAMVDCATAAPTDWPSLVAYRRPLAMAGKRTSWPPEQLAIARAEWGRRGATKRQLAAMANELGISRTSFTKTMTCDRMRDVAANASAVMASTKQLKKTA